LVRGIATVERAASTRESKPILEGILVKAEQDGLQLLATDLELSIECFVPARVQAQGAAVLSSKVSGQIIRKWGSDEGAYKTDPQGVAHIESGRSRFMVHTMVDDEFPTLPEIEEKPVCRIGQGTLRRMIRKTAFAAASDDARPFLTGVLVEAEGDELRLVATDSSRLAFHQGKLESPLDGSVSCILPVRTLTELMRLLGDHDSEVQFSLSPRQAVFRLAGVQIVSRVIEGQFPDYGRALQAVQESKFVGDRHEILAAVERASLVARKSAPVIRLSAEGPVLTLTSREAEVGQAYEEVEIEIETVPGNASYQARFLIDVLRALESEKVRFELGDGLKQGRIVGLDERDYTYIVMPVRVG